MRVFDTLKPAQALACAGFYGFDPNSIGVPTASLPLMREVDFAEQKTEGEKNYRQYLVLSLPQSALLTAPSSEGAKRIVQIKESAAAVIAKCCLFFRLKLESFIF